MSCILSANTIDLPDEFDQDQMTLDLGVRSINDIVLHGRITICGTDTPIVGAVVKVIDAEGHWLCHTFSGCNGLYMLRLPDTLAGQTITIAASCSDCPETPAPCICPPPPCPQG